MESDAKADSESTPSPPVDTAAAAQTSLVSTATRWRTYLREHSTAFRTLQEERERGWQSSAMDAWYARRQAPAPAQSTREDTSGPASSTALGTTAFQEANIAVLAERYRQHARRITQLAAPAFFAAPLTPSGTPPLFLDLGAAPGGVSKYLLEDLHWRGVGVTLASTSGGIEVDERLVDRRAHGADYLLLDGDVTQPACTWRRSAAYAVHTATPHGGEEKEEEADGIAALSEALLDVSGQQPLAAFRLVNGGAVLDHGQRERWERSIQAEAASTAGAVDVSRGEPTVRPSATRLPAAAPILPWFSLLVPQLAAALTYVAEGGAVMLVHGAPHCASLFILLRCLDDIFGAAPAAAADGSPTTSQCRVHLLETMHLAKPPVYVLWTDVWAGGVGGSTDSSTTPHTKKATQAAQQRLLEALDPLSPRISPMPPQEQPQQASFSSHIAAARKEDTGLVAQDLLEAKQRFWLGESAEGFQLAVEGFARYGGQAEAIWASVESFLRRRRERAEREMHTSAARLSRHGGGGGGGAPAKRLRREH